MCCQCEVSPPCNLGSFHDEATTTRGSTEFARIPPTQGIHFQFRHRSGCPDQTSTRKPRKCTRRDNHVQVLNLCRKHHVQVERFQGIGENFEGAAHGKSSQAAEGKCNRERKSSKETQSVKLKYVLDFVGRKFEEVLAVLCENVLFRATKKYILLQR